MVELLELNKNKNALSFSKQALNIEFTEIIGKMDESCRISSKNRDEILAKMWRELLKKQMKDEKRKKFSIRIRVIIKTSREREIYDLLTSINTGGVLGILYKIKNFFDLKRFFWPEIIIWYKNKSYKLKPFKEKRKKVDPIAFPKLPTKEEIYEMLIPKKDNE
jgi:hypothetical protein